MPNITFDQFVEWLFPGEDIDFEANPYRPFPQEVAEVLSDIHEETGVPVSWLEKTAGYIVDGLAGLKCLWYLHGAEGTCPVKPEVPNWVVNVQEHAVRVVRDDPDEQRRDLIRVHRTFTNWEKGTFILVKTYHDGKIVEQNNKIGKWLERYIAWRKTDDAYARGYPSLTEGEIIDMRKDLKHRAKSSQMTWKISAHPFDVLTMSYRRAWSSCMRPESDHDWQYGILTDMAAGTAMMFFYYSGADMPAGRLVLRPAIDASGQICIYSGHTIYGSGPKQLRDKDFGRLIDEAGFEDIHEETGIYVYDGDLCHAGDEARALSRLVFSDVAHDGCQQDQDDYDRAYSKLRDADWPEPQLDIGELESVAERWFGKISCEIDVQDIVPDVDVEEIVEELTYGIEHLDVDDLLELLEDSGSSANEHVWNHLAREHPSIQQHAEELSDDISEIEYNYRSALETRLAQALQEEKTMVLVYDKPLGELSDETQRLLNKNDTTFGIKMIWEYKPMCRIPQPWSETTPSRFVPHQWAPDYPPSEIKNALGLYFPDEWLRRTSEGALIGTFMTHNRPLVVPYEPGDPRQLEFDFAAPPNEMAHVIVALWLDDAQQEALDEMIEEWEEEDGGMPPFMEEAAKMKVLPACETGDSKCYMWHEFAGMER